MVPRARHSRASSVPSSPTRPTTPTSTTTTTTSGGGVSSLQPLTTTTSSPSKPTEADAEFEAPNGGGFRKASFLQPRVAVALNVPSPWHPWLFALRLCSILPAVWWGTPSVLHLLLRLLEIVVKRKYGADEADVPLTETFLAAIWCFASGYLSFFFTDCLMSRWLINYTPQATMVRLLTINAVNAYVTSTVLSLAGGFHDTRLLLPGWIGIATTLTVCYHITHQKINIRKETSTSVNVFSIASYISMLTLLVHMHNYQTDYPKIPLLVRVEYAWGETVRVASQMKDSVEQYRDL